MTYTPILVRGTGRPISSGRLLAAADGVDGAPEAGVVQHEEGDDDDRRAR